MKKNFLKFAFGATLCLGLFTAIAQEQPSDPGTGGGGGGTQPGNNSQTCYNNYLMGGDWVITRCNGCSQVNRVKAINSAFKGTCTAK